MEPKEQKPTTGNENSSKKWEEFQKLVQKDQAKIKGKFLFQTLQYDPYIIDVQNRTNWINRKFSLNSTQKYQRSFMLYLPSVLKTQMELLVLLHGTNQTLFDTELVAQGGNEQKQKLYGLMGIADKQSFVIVIPQSRGIDYRGKKYYGWQPGSEDLRYLLAILQKITANSFSIQKNLPPFRISCHNISVLGFSNGGLFSTDLYLNYNAFMKSTQTKNFSILVFINYMGGVEFPASPLQLISLDPQAKRNTPMIIITCKKQQNYGPCYRAHKLLQCLESNVHFIQINHHKHQFTYFATKIVYQWIQKAKKRQIKMTVDNNYLQIKGKENQVIIQN